MKYLQIYVNWLDSLSTEQYQQFVGYMVLTLQFLIVLLFIVRHHNQRNAIKKQHNKLFKKNKQLKKYEKRLKRITRRNHFKNFFHRKHQKPESQDKTTAYINAAWEEIEGKK